MAKFKEQLPYDLIKQFEELDLGATDMMEKMTRAGAEVVYEEIKRSYLKHLKKLII